MHWSLFVRLPQIIVAKTEDLGYVRQAMYIQQDIAAARYVMMLPPLNNEYAG